MAPPGVMTMRVIEVLHETAEAHSLVLEPVEPADQPVDYRPGQFLTLRIPTDGDEGAARCYSLCSSPLYEDKLKVTVKRVSGGFGSNWICDNVAENDVLDVLKPSGVFTPSSLDSDLLLIAAGSGITPVMSILKSALYSGTGRVTLVYANQDERSVIFREELHALALEYGTRLTLVHWLESLQGLPTAEGLRGVLEPFTDREAFVCGPEAFMELAVQTLTDLEVPSRNVHVERFMSLSGNPFVEPDVPLPGDEEAGETSTVEVTLDGETREVDWPQNSKLLDVLLAAGMDAPFSCREGACSACACILVEGEVDLERNQILDATDLEDGIILGCQATPLTDRVKVTYDD